MKMIAVLFWSLVLVLIMAGCIFNVQQTGPTTWIVSWPGLTETPVNSPTPEINPTLEPSPEPQCTGRLVAGWNVRDGPTLKATRIATSGDFTQTLTFEARTTNDGYTWYAFWFSPTLYAWTVSQAVVLDNAALCAKLPSVPF